MSTIAHSRKRGGPLGSRAVRVRNACVRHAARSLGLPVPDRAALTALSDDVSLRDAIAWWRAQATGVAAQPASESAGLLLLKLAWITTVTLLGLAFSYGHVQ